MSCEKTRSREVGRTLLVGVLSTVALTACSGGSESAAPNAVVTSEAPSDTPTVEYVRRSDPVPVELGRVSLTLPGNGDNWRVEKSEDESNFTAVRYSNKYGDEESVEVAVGDMAAENLYRENVVEFYGCSVAERDTVVLDDYEVSQTYFGSGCSRGNGGHTVWFLDGSQNRAIDSFTLVTSGEVTDETVKLITESVEFDF